MTEERVEVAIIGAGPAGTSAAFETASGGRSTVLLEEHPQVGRPPHCTGIMWAHNYQRAGLEFPERIVQTHPEYVRVFFGLDRSITFHAPGFVIVDRPALDCHLADRAVKAGTELRLRNYVSKIERRDGEWMLTVNDDGVTKRIRSKSLICADGHGTLLRHIGILPPREIISCMQYEIRTIRTEDGVKTINAYLSPDLAPGGYGWVVPAGDGVAKVGVGVRNSPIPCMHYMENLLKFGLEKQPEIVERMGGIVQTSGVIRHNLSDGLMVVGGAAGYVNPITGAGIVAGYWSGKLAGKASVEAFKNNDLSKEGLSSFRKNSRTLLDRPFDRTLSLRIAYDRLGRSEFGALYGLIDRYAITKGFKKKSMMKAAVHTMIRHPSLAGFFWRLARARNALTL